METNDDVKTKYANHSYDELIDLILHKDGVIKTLQELLFGKKSERFVEDPPGMRSLFDEAEATVEVAEPEEETEIKGHKRKKSRGKRKPLPDNLPRERVEHDLKDEEKTCSVHNVPLTRIGEKCSEQLEIIPATVKVIQNVTFTYKCPCCVDVAEKASIISSNLPAMPIPKSFATPSLLAFIAVSKFQDALPLYRQEGIFLRYGIELGRTSMARWMIKAGELVEPIINLMRETLLEQEVIGCDETPVQVLDEPARRPEQKSYMWVCDSFGSDPIILFHYDPHRSAKAAAELLDGYSGIIVCDGLKSYVSYANVTSATLAGCMAHVRRMFSKAEKAAKKANPKGSNKPAEALKLIKRLYQIERDIKGKSLEEIKKAREERSKPLMEEFREWLVQQENKCLPKSLLGKAISYAFNQWSKLLVFLNNPRTPIDNNRTEGHIRPFVIGRNNWMFSQSQAGARTSANLYSLIETAKANGIDPFSYLALIFKELPKTSTLEEVERLLPYRAKNHFDIKAYHRPS